MNEIDAIYYINLDHRKDRNDDFLKCMSDLDVPVEKIQRISAIYNPIIGPLGCVKSHIKAIETFLESGLNICLVCEDDFQYKNKDTFWSDIKKVFDTNIEIDVLQLSYNHTLGPECYKTIDTDYYFLKKVTKSVTTSSYIITRNFAPILLENFKESSKMLEQFGLIHKKAYVIDIFWHTLQPRCNWYLITPSIGYQRESYSDICKSHQNYKV